MKSWWYLYLYDVKSPGTKYRLMAVLMVSSQVLLTAFVIYWLRGQYREERNRLRGELSQEYFLVHDQLVDSMLMKRLVIPSLNDTLMVRIDSRLSHSPEELKDSASAVVMMKQFFAETHEDQDIRSIDITTLISDEERMVRSIKLFINENQEAFRSDSGLHVYALNLDSSSLVLNLEHALEERDWAFVLRWPAEEHSQGELSRTHGIVLNGGPDRYLPALQVQQFSSYLVRAILPQITFGLILLLLSGSALLFAYRSLRRQLALNRLRDDFIGNISHELKTPVSTVKIALEALRNFDTQKDPRVREEYLAMASSELERLERLVGKVLHHEMLDNPSLVLDIELCDLGELTRSVLRTLDHPVREAGALVSISEEGEFYRVPVDRIYMEGVILNLIDNSLKYSGDSPLIKINIQYNSTGTLLSIMDKGPGIPEEYRDQVFDKFFRIPTGNTHNIKGYGLGLNFAFQVMARHGGTISYSNLREGGCCFNLQFPPAKT